MDMQSRISSAKPLVQGAANALNSMKYEIASELAINAPQSGSWGHLTSRDCGRVGGNITRKMVELGKQQITQ